MGIRPRYLEIFCLTLLASAWPSGCVSDKSHEGSLPELDVQDPDPEKDKAGPDFCNPTGKTGAELTKCYEHNEGLYKEFDEEAKEREPWFNFPPDSWMESKELDEKYVLNVTAEAEAVKRLEAAPLVELAAADVQHFTGKPAAFPGKKPFLVRGLVYFKDTGTFTVFEKDQSIYVRHDSTGATTPPEKRSAVVVFLGQKPKDVFVDCQVAE